MRHVQGEGMTWPHYSPACRKDVDALLRKGGSLSAYRANPQVGVEPSKGSWAWRVERDIEARFRVKHAVVVNSGTAALHAALASLALRPGDEVVTTPFTFSATLSAILLSGGTPVFADVDPYTFCITKETVKRVVTKKTKAILPVHLFGGLADIPSLRSFGVPVIEDACQAVGARCREGYSGTLGQAGCYSFNGGKNVPAGEAGCLVTNSDDVAIRARLLMNHGENFGQKQVGLNYRPNEVTCCIAWHGLQELEERNQRRILLAETLTSALTYDPQRVSVRFWNRLPHRFDGSHVYYVYPFSVHPLRGCRDDLLKRLGRSGIKCSGGYITPPLHHYKAFREFIRPGQQLRNVCEASFRSLCLISDLSPDKSLSYARNVAKAILESMA